MTQELDAVVVKDRIDAGGLDTYYEIHGAGEGQAMYAGIGPPAPNARSERGIASSGG